MYSGEPADLEKFKQEKLSGIISKWMENKVGTHRTEVKIEGRVMYLFIIRTSQSTKLRDVSAEHDILVKERDEKIPDDQMTIRDSKGRKRKDIDKIKDNI
jgi:hypothetical protein